MIASYLTVAFRFFIKERFFSVINVASLALGLAIVFLIGLYIVYERDFDRFHHQSGQTYRVASYIEMGPNHNNYNAVFSPMAQALRDDLPEVEVAARLESDDGIIFRRGDKIFPEDKLLYVDADFFKLFNFRLLSPHQGQILSKPYEVLLTPFLVEKYFGEQAEKVVGSTIEINREVYTVTGIIEESPANSHLRYHAIASLASLPVSREQEWLSLNLSLYIRLRPGTDTAAVNRKFEDVLARHIKDYEGMTKRNVIIRPYLQPLTSIHLHSNLQGEVEMNSSITTLYIFATVGFVVLLLACVNFVNIATARSANRAKEVGVRKVVGAGVLQLMRQFIFEAILMVLAATAIAVLIVAIAQFPFQIITGKNISAATLFEPLHLVVILIFVLVLGVAAGSYPAFFLTSFNPTQVLRGSVRLGFKSRRLRSILVVLQFSIAIVLIIATMVVDGQLHFMRSRKLGFDQENVIVIENGDKIANASSFLQTLRAQPTVSDVGTGQFKPIGNYDGLPMAPENSESILLVNYSFVDTTYLKTLQYKFIQGRNFSSAPGDSTAIILNESAATALLGDQPLNKLLKYEGKQYTVIGVVEDFNFQSLRNAISPVVFFRRANQRYICARLKPGDPSQAVAAIRALWRKQYPDIPFVFTYLDETYTSLYKEERRLGATFGVFTVLALIIACFGLVGLAVYMSQQRSKEISVRKVFGASVMQIVMLLSRDFIRLIIISCVLAVPAAYYLMERWLNGFAYHIAISAWIIVQGCLVVLIAGINTVVIQAVRASLFNPAQSLKEE